MVQRQSPPTDRVVRVLELLASQPNDGVALSDLARRLDMSKATALGVTGALTRAGYLVRSEETKTYKLGPALLGLGRAATEARASLTFARPEMERLNEELGVAASIATLAGDKIAILARTGPYGELDRIIKIGQRYPYTPPSGCVLAAWLADDAIEEWLVDFPEVSMDGSMQHLRALVDSARKVGFVIEKMSGISVGALTVLAGLDGHNVPAPAVDAIQNMVAGLADRHYIARDVKPGAKFAITFVTSPSFDADGRPDLLMGLLVFRTDVTYEEVQQYGAAVQAAAARVTERAGGRNPWLDPRVPKCRVGL